MYSPARWFLKGIAMIHPQRRPAAATRHAGFTLIEVLVAVGIIVLLSGLVLSGVLVAKKKATETRVRSDLALIGTALEAYKGDFGDYPRFDDDDTPDSLNVQLDRGARLLCRALLSPGPAGPPTAANPLGFNVSVGNERGYDGADGPGFRVRPGGVGKVYGPYIDSSKFKLGNPAAPIDTTTGLPKWDKNYFTDATILDINGSPILYYPATPGASPSVSYVMYALPAGNGNSQPVRPVYNCIDNGWYGLITPTPTYPSAYLLSQNQMEYILGDRNMNYNGKLTAPNQAVTTLPYLLWTAGADGHFGFGIDPTTNTPLVPTAANANSLKSDDITNFDFPADLKK
jgi:prepilin-type N-terminal cleavage/methylation domain-containing protein